MNNLIKTEAQGKYLKISTNDIHALIQKELNTQGLAYQCTQPQGDSRITRYRLHDIKIDDGLSQLTPEIFFRNSEVPGTALMLYIGAYRFICANGLVMGVGDGGRLIHRVGQTADTFVAGISDMISRSVVHLVDDLQDVITESRSIKVNNAIDIVASLPIQATVKQDALNKIILGNTKEDVSTVWGLYNEVNMLTRLRTKKSNVALEKDIGLLDHIKLLNQYTKAA